MVFASFHDIWNDTNQSSNCHFVDVLAEFHGGGGRASNSRTFVSQEDYGRSTLDTGTIFSSSIRTIGSITHETKQI